MYDLIGVGVGPFHLGMAALAAPYSDSLDTVFFDENDEFEWHPGMLLEGSDLQVPFIADLVTFADPTSPYSFLNYVHKQNRLYQFYFFNRFDIPRREYNAYARWVKDQLGNVRFGKRVTDVVMKDDHFEVHVLDKKSSETDVVLTRHLSMGTGTKPMVPGAMDKDVHEHDAIHSSRFLQEKDQILSGDHVALIGSGQSAAEIFIELMHGQQDGKPHISWYTRSSGFFQLEAGKLGLELFSPDYVDYFHNLPLDKRLSEGPMLTRIRNGVEEATLHEIYETLYHRTVDGGESGVTIQSRVELTGMSQSKKGAPVSLELNEWQEEQAFQSTVDKVILATGYRPDLPGWFGDIAKQAEFEDDDHPSVDRNYRLTIKDRGAESRFYLLTDILHSHGISATNLQLAVMRNAMIINDVSGRELYPEQRNTVFQQFGAPDKS
ncbi:lysine N(6)-hydroxylase/L-ornithine N(5)-oxygenase family protein [Salisediminibacterium selenitireducens]|uniref:L-lysine N6-monooxygenase MbtG n=1 Tax=Bacillus selenitireducens (strain ATCC 700615 / DSM 15326 / MLS10) TaxID=439292 RepID=D6Y0K5_BACIE|nr:SidA/IucD/PvdA family monooxygenase [Salisediminibacterium selenitireducens]ADI00573.1 L-lysine 6-monooxygenase (NADPH) [[Bacillus] selenitireducens MLS10]